MYVRKRPTPLASRTRNHLNNIRISGIKFSHIVVIETALHVYCKLIADAGIENPKSDINLPAFSQLGFGR